MREILKKNCIGCGKEFTKSINRSLKSWNTNARFCSRRCCNNDKFGHIPWNKGLKSLYPAWNKGLPGLKGELNGAWKGTDEKYWKNKALERDNNTCQSCGLYDLEILHVDHIKPRSMFPELRYVLENLQSICPNCHERKTLKEKREGNYKKLI